MSDENDSPGEEELKPSSPLAVASPSSKIKHERDPFDEDYDEDDSDFDFSFEASSSSDEETEEEKLNKYNRAVQYAMQNITDYSAQHRVCDYSYETNDLALIRDAHINFKKNFPLSNDMWLKLIRAERRVATSTKELYAIYVLFQSAFCEYYSIELANEYASFALTAPNADVVWSELLITYGIHCTKGSSYFELYRDWIYSNQNMSESEKVEANIKSFVQQLANPIVGIEKTYPRFKEYLKKHPNYTTEFTWEIVDERYEKAKNDLEKLLTFESRLEAVDINDTKQFLQIYFAYLQESENSDLDKNIIQLYYEQLLLDYNNNSECWEQYIDYILRRDEVERPKDCLNYNIFKQSALDVTDRAVQHCRTSGKLHIRRLRTLEEYGSKPLEFAEIFDFAVNQTYDNDRTIYDLWNEYIAILIRITDWTNVTERLYMRKNFQVGWGMLSLNRSNLIFDPYREYLQLWARVEYTKICDLTFGRTLWEMILKLPNNIGRAALWMELIQLDIESNNYDEARRLFKEALNPYTTDAESLCSAWRRFERSQGTLESIEACVNYCDKFMTVLANRKDIPNIANYEYLEPNYNLHLPIMLMNNDNNDAEQASVDNNDEPSTDNDEPEENDDVEPETNYNLQSEPDYNLQPKENYNFQQETESNDKMDAESLENEETKSIKNEETESINMDVSETNNDDENKEINDNEQKESNNEENINNDDDKNADEVNPTDEQQVYNYDEQQAYNYDENKGYNNDEEYNYDDNQDYNYYGYRKNNNYNEQKSFKNKKNRKRKQKNDYNKVEAKRFKEPKPEPIEIDTSKDNCRVFLSNISYEATVDDIKAALPELQIIDIQLNKTAKGKPIGFGYMDLANEDEIPKALAKDLVLVKKRPLYISKIARDKKDRVKFKYSNDVEPNKIFIKGLPENCTNEQLKESFQKFGEILDIRLVRAKNGKFKGVAYLDYELEDSARKAVFELNLTEFHGATITVAISAPPQRSIEPPTIQPKNIDQTKKASKDFMKFMPTSVRKRLGADIMKKEDTNPTITTVEKPAEIPTTVKVPDDIPSTSTSTKSNDYFRQFLQKN